MTTELEDLMDKFAEDYDNADVDAIIAFVRKQLMMYDSGIKPKRTEIEQLDMSAIVSRIAGKKIVSDSKPTKTMKRRI